MPRDEEVISEIEEVVDDSERLKAMKRRLKRKKPEQDMEQLDAQVLNDDSSETIEHNTELGEAMHHLTDDSIDPKNKLSKIDTKTLVNEFQIAGIVVNDILCAFGMQPKKCLITTTQLKRLSCSLGGMRSKQIVEMAVGKREQDAGNSLMKKMMGMPK